MFDFSSLLRELPLYLLNLPILLMAFSVHETAHGYIALKLGDPTARNLGRLTLNPIKHIDPIGFISMLLFRVGWAKPVPINTRHFKKPRRDMALTGAAGPISNLLLALIHLLILRLVMLFFANAFYEDAFAFLLRDPSAVYKGSLSFTFASLLVYILELGVIMNISLAIFNLIPIPPFDGSRIFYVFLPQRLYFGVMKYERIIMLVMMVLFFFGFLSGPLSWILEHLLDGMYFISGMYAGDSFFGLPDISKTYGVLRCMSNYLQQLFVLAF